MLHSSFGFFKLFCSFFAKRFLFPLHHEMEKFKRSNRLFPESRKKGYLAEACFSTG